MITPSRFAISLVVSSFLLASPASAAFTCASVAARGDTDPDGQTYGNKFHSEAVTNASGDTMFSARPNKFVDGLYLYPSGGPAETVARALSTAVGADFFRTGRPFTQLSLNDGADLGFKGRLHGGGYMVVVREAGGALESAARTGDVVPLPAAGTYSGFPWVSRINSAGVIAFVGEVSGGADGVFLYDAPTDTPSAGVLEGDVTAGGREICDIKEVSLGDSGAYVIHATTKVLCADLLESPLDGLFLAAGGAPIRIALEGDPTPIPGTTYQSFPKVSAKHAADPKINASNDVVFKADITGTESKTVLFTWDFIGMAATEVAATGDLAPGPQAGTFRRLNDFDITDSGQVFLNAKLGNSPGKTGVFEFDGPSAAITRLDAPPMPPFGPSSKYKSLHKVNGVASDGSHIAIGMKVKDSVAPKSKAGVLNCVP